jgi:hypothetical protein
LIAASRTFEERVLLYSLGEGSLLLEEEADMLLWARWQQIEQTEAHPGYSMGLHRFVPS